MRKPKRNTRLWLYLFQSGILQTGDEQQIAQAKAEYWRRYDTNLKRLKRTSKRTFSISFPESEIQHIRKHAKEFDATIIDYIKLLVKADLTHTSLLEQLALCKEIFQILHYYKNAIADIEEHEMKNWLGKSTHTQEFAKIIASIEQEIIGLIKKKS